MSHLFINHTTAPCAREGFIPPVVHMVRFWFIVSETTIYPAAGGFLYPENIIDDHHRAQRLIVRRCLFVESLEADRHDVNLYRGLRRFVHRFNICLR